MFNSQLMDHSGVSQAKGKKTELMEKKNKKKKLKCKSIAVWVHFCSRGRLASHPVISGVSVQKPSAGGQWLTSFGKSFYCRIFLILSFMYTS